MLNANEKHEYSALYTYLMQMKNMSIVPCMKNMPLMQMKNTSKCHVYILNANEKHEYSALYTYLLQMKNMSIVPVYILNANEKHEV